MWTYIIVIVVGIWAIVSLVQQVHEHVTVNHFKEKWTRTAFCVGQSAIATLIFISMCEVLGKLIYG